MLLSSNYFPNIEYLSKVIHSDEVTIDQHEHFVKQTYRSRCHIFGPNGLQSLTVPVSRKNHMHMRDVRINYAENWVIQHLKSLKTAYASSPFFEDYLPYFDQILQKKVSFLVDLNQQILEQTLQCVGANVSFNKTEDFMPYKENDSRLVIHPKKETNFTHTSYFQCFDERHGHIPNLSSIDLLFNEGPNTISFL